VRSLWAAGYLLRRLRSEAGVVLLLLGLVFVTSFLAAGAPRLFNLAADAALVRELQDAPDVERDFSLSSIDFTPTGGDELGAVAGFGDLSLDAFPASLRALISEHHYVATTPRYGIDEGLLDASGRPRFDTYVAMRYQDGIENAISYVSGRAPASTGRAFPRAIYSVDDPPPGEPPAAAEIEVALSETTAAAIGATVGDTLDGTLDTSDPIMLAPAQRGIRGIIYQRIEVRFTVVGIFAINDPEAELWYGDLALQRPVIGGSDEFPINYATALIAPASYPAVAATGLPFQFSWRYFVAPELADVGQLDAIVPDLLRLQSQGAGAIFGGIGNGQLELHTGLQTIIDRYQSRRAASEAVLSVATIGPLSLAAAAIVMLAVMLVMRRRTTLELARSRGASSVLLLAAQAWEAAIIAGGAGLLGLAAAISFVPGRASDLSPSLAIGTAFAAAAALVGATWPTARRSLSRVGREDPPLLPTSPRRLVLELTVVGLALAGILLLTQRGLVIGAGGPGAVVHFDPFLAAVPVLAGLAVGMVAVRLYPLPIRAFGWLSAGRRDLVPVLGLRSVGRQSAAGNLPLLVLMLIAAFGSFASVVLSSIDRGQTEAAWLQVGADYRIEAVVRGSGNLGDPTTVPGVEAVAAGFVDPSALFSERPTQRSVVVLHAVDPATYSEVTAGSPIDPRWPSGFNSTATPGTPGTSDNPIPAIVSQGRPNGGELLRPGSTFTVVVGVHPVSFVAVDVRPSFPGVRSGSNFVVASYTLLQEASDGGLAPSVLFVRGPAGIAPALETLVPDRARAPLVTSRFGAYDALHGTPLMATVTIGFAIALAIAIGYAALSILAALTLTAARRRTEMAFLRTLGLSAQQGIWLTLVEHGPPVVLALVPGIALGIWIAAILSPSLGLGSFIGPDATFRLSVAWGQLALVGAGLVILVVGAVVASTWLARRSAPVDALRMGGD
jgi:putative ABC transport system permease protein